MRLTPEREKEIRSIRADFGGIIGPIADELLAYIDALRAENEKLKRIVVEANRIHETEMRPAVDALITDRDQLKENNLILIRENATLRHEFKMAQASMPLIRLIRKFVRGNE